MSCASPATASPRAALSAVTLDGSWLQGAELVVVEMIPAGAIERTLVVDGFRMAP